MAADQAHAVAPMTAEGHLRSEAVPDQLVFQLPAHRGLVGLIGAALDAALTLVDRTVAAGNHLEAAVLPVAHAMIQGARPWTPLEVSIAIDDTDVFVRLAVELLDRDEPAPFGEHLRSTLRRNLESHELVHEDGRVLAVLQAPLEPVESS